jgi:uncharacterized OB-fold protein
MSNRFPLPDPDFAPTRAYFESAAAGKLSIPRCPDCMRWDWYPTGSCAACDRTPTAWIELGGDAELFSFSIVRRAFAAPFRDCVPFVAALVVPQEAPPVRIPTNIVDCDFDALVIGMPLRVVFRTLQFAGIEGQVIAPQFVPGASTRPSPGLVSGP